MGIHRPGSALRLKRPLDAALCMDAAWVGRFSGRNGGRLRVGEADDNLLWVAWFVGRLLGSLWFKVGVKLYCLV